MVVLIHSTRWEHWYGKSKVIGTGAKQQVELCANGMEYLQETLLGGDVIKIGVAPYECELLILYRVGSPNSQ